ncbi:exonuclease SbcCD subunit D [Gryllotalpicola ginsengisoli]|uniref:exonuclease SbcCD subunit D n=1 Tax=Gryllotalpicola ginsengisoli TaxID=444608 RepID=UPI0003B6105E|nr:exonuclease SbcCD subunit D [Gryllotalpicola ginsengisoli]
MRILHTSDWHVGRTFHGHPTLPALAGVLDALAREVREREVDVVAVAGDVFDSATPSSEAFAVLGAALRGIREAGAQLVVTSGNHDSPARLGFQSEFAAFGGVHIVTRAEDHAEPVTLRGRDGVPVDFYGIPFLEPALIRHLWPDEPLRSQADALRFAMRNVRAAAAASAHRSVVLAHCFAAGGQAEASDAERDLSAGGLDVVPLSVFDGVDYAALGHIHGRAALAEHVRYSGAPLHYSFSEAGKPRGAWLVELGADGPAEVQWVDLPVPRALAVITGELDELLTDAALEAHRDDWVAAILTDRTRPLDAMRKLQSRFPHCASLEHRPAVVDSDGARGYRERVGGKDRPDPEVIAAFLAHVRNGEGPSPAEAELIAELVAERAAAEQTA